MTGPTPSAWPTHELTTRLRATTQDRYRQAALELLIEHDFWLRRRDFVAATIGANAHGDVWIDWRLARTEFSQDEFEPCSSTQRAVLDFAIALGEDRYLFNRMGFGNSAALIRATCAALGVDRGWSR